MIGCDICGERVGHALHCPDLGSREVWALGQARKHGTDALSTIASGYVEASGQNARKAAHEAFNAVPSLRGGR